jgi:hypothetical protein
MLARNERLLPMESMAHAPLDRRLRVANFRFGTANNNPGSPQLTAITFAEDGSMILGFRDLMGDMAGVNVAGEIGPASGQGALAPCCTAICCRRERPDGDFSLEANGRVAGLTSNGRGSLSRAGSLDSACPVGLPRRRCEVLTERLTLCDTLDR